jgi:hypothetical protein
MYNEMLTAGVNFAHSSFTDCSVPIVFTLNNKFFLLASFVNFADERLELKKEIIEYIDQAGLSIRRISVNGLVTLGACLRAPPMGVIKPHVTQVDNRASQSKAAKSRFCLQRRLTVRSVPTL